MEVCWELHKNAALSQTNPGSNTQQKSDCTATFLQSRKPFELDEQDM